MITVKLAKSKLENQEGLNHIWVHLEPLGVVRGELQIGIQLPSGIHRSKNLSCFHENESGNIIVYQPNISDDLFIEIFTQDPVRCGEKIITFTLSFTDINGVFNRVEHFVPLQIVNDDEMEDLEINEEVVRKIKDLQCIEESSDQKSNDLRPKVFKMDPSPNSDLEKKYWIEG